MPGRAQRPTERVYWDSCVFLSYINGMSDRVPILDAILLSAQQGTTAIFTSTLTITEVAYATTDQGEKQLNDEIEASIDALVLGGPVRFIEISRYTSINARALIRGSITSGPIIKPPDAIHVAAALQLGLPEFQTYDTKLLKHNGLNGLVIREPVAIQPFLSADGSTPL